MTSKEPASRLFSFRTWPPITPVMPSRSQNKHFTCISLDLRGTGETDKTESAYSTELLADDVAAFMRALGIRQAHVSGLSLGAAIGMWVAAKYPDTVSSLSLHSGWPKS